MPRIKTSLAQSLVSVALLAATPAHAQTPALQAATNPHTYALPSSIVGGPLRLYSETTYRNGSVVLGFESERPASHTDGSLIYTVRVHHPSHDAALAWSKYYSSLWHTASP